MHQKGTRLQGLSRLPAEHLLEINVKEAVRQKSRGSARRPRGHHRAGNQDSETERQ